MKKIKNMFLGSAVVMTAGIILQACSAENPFGQDSGMATLSMQTSLRGDVQKISTRAGGEIDEAYLNEKLVVYIEEPGRGVIRKYKGKNNIPGNISLPVGEYVVEGWSGDSVSASFDKKFYRGYENIELNEGQNTMILKCNIANVLTSINTEVLKDALTDVKVTIGHTRAQLEFTGETLGNIGYFMMPNGTKEKPVPQTLNYVIDGKQSDGSAFHKEGAIENVERAHHYSLVLKADAQDIITGGALVKIEIVDVPVIEEDVIVFPAPSYRVTVANELFDAEEQLNLVNGARGDVVVRVLGYGGLSSVKLNLSDNFGDLAGIVNGKNLIKESDARTALEGHGMQVLIQDNKDQIADNSGREIDIKELYLTLSTSYLAGLAESEQEFVLDITATDGRGFTSNGKLRFANSDAAVERLAPVGTAPAPDPANQPMAVQSHSATLTGYVYDQTATDYGIRYRKQGDTVWMEARPSNSRSNAPTRAGVKIPYTVTLTGLEAGATYEYVAFCEDFEDTNIQTFTTESHFIIPNASFEDWSDWSENPKVLIPGAGGQRTFWDSGNHGSSTMSVTLTQGTDSPKHSGEKAAKLRSQFVGIGAAGKFAAGNIFTGTYLETQGTDGRLEFGREYNGSHPTALEFYANYRPGIVQKKGAKSGYLAEGDTDQAQIYVALSTEPVEVRTKTSNQKLFNKDDACIIAYGQITWDSAFGADDVLEKVRIDLDYKASAKNNKAKYLIIVCSASKFGDFFCGGEGSTMILDDFELVYDN